MKRKYSSTIKNLKEMLQEVSIYTIIVIILMGIFYFYLSDDMSSFILTSLLIFIAYFFTVLFPIIILYRNYINYSKNSFLILEKDRLIINDNKIYIEDIIKIKIYATYQHFNNHVGTTSLPYNDYFYYLEINVKKNEMKYVLTSLLGYELDKDLKRYYPNINFENIIKSFPTIG